MFQPAHEYSKATAKARLAQLDGYKIVHTGKQMRRLLKFDLFSWYLSKNIGFLISKEAYKEEREGI